MSNSGVKKLSPEPLEAGGTLRSNPAGATSIPFEITVMIRTPCGMDIPEIGNPGTPVKE
jgi:hypothetical protein